MAKKVPITKVLSCFVVFVILMSAVPVSTFALDGSNNATEASNSSNDLVIYLNDTGATILTDVSNDTRETVSALSCNVYVKIDDDTCVGYDVYVDGVYELTEGKGGTPDGYCAFYVTAGTHKFELRKNGCTTSKSWYCQCGTVYRWVSMPDYWCECSDQEENKEVKFRGTVTGTSPEGLIGAINWYVSVDEWISGSLHCDEIDVTIAMCPPWGSYDNSISKGDKVEVYGKVDPWGEGKNCAVGLNGESYYIKKISSESLSISVWTDKSEYKIGETVTINYQTNKKCTAKLTITKPDGGDIVYGPNEIPASTRSKSATAGYPTGKRTVVFEAWAGAEYKKATCYFEVVEVAKKVKFRGKILADAQIISFYSFDVKLDEILDDPTGNLKKGETVNVYGHRAGPARVDDVIVGAKVDVFGDYQGYVEGATFERIFLSDWGESSSDHYVKIIEPTVWNVKFEGIISKIFNKESSNWYDAKIKVTKVTGDPSHTLDINEIVNVYRANENAYEDAVSVGDLVEVCAEYNSKYEDSRYALRDWQHHIKKMEVKTPVHNIDTGKDFSSIQAAINDSDTSPGNTITVDPGTYTENVDVTKSLTIKSTSGNPEDTIVQAAVSNQNYQNVFTVTSDNVHIDGFTIKGASYFWCSGILLDSNNCIISNNTFEGNAIGIWIHPPSLGNNVIRNNKFSSSSGYSPSTALYLEAANNKIYLNNFIIGIEGSDYPGNFWNSPSKTTYTYKGNTFTNYLGNYWEEYTDTDADSDGIWDHPYSIDEDKDNYPLVWRFENYVSVEEKPEIEFIGIFDHSLSMWNGNAQGYFFSIHAAPVRQVVTCGQACIVIPLNTPDKKLAAISLFLKTLKKGDMVSIYAELKSEGTFCDLGFTSDKYFVRRESAKLEEEYRQHLINTHKFYDNYSINVLTYVGWWSKNIDAAMEGMEDTYIWGIEKIITGPLTAYVSVLSPMVGVALSELGDFTDAGFIIDTLTGLTKTYTLKDITEVLYNRDPKTLKTDLKNTNSNACLLVSAFENGEEVSSLLSDRREKLAKTYTDLCSYDQKAFSYIKKQPKFISNSISDYRMFHQHTSMLATTLAIDFILTTACEKYYSGKSELNYNLAEEAGSGFFVQRLDDDFIKRAHFFGYFDRIGDTDEYKLVMPKYFCNVFVVGDENTFFYLKGSDGVIAAENGTGKYQVLEIRDYKTEIKDPDTAVEYTLTVQCLKHAGPYEIQIQLCPYPPLSSNLYPKIEVLS